MIESAGAVAGLDDLLRTPGLDGVMVGPADLAVTMAIGTTSIIRISAPRSPRCVPRAGGTRSRSGYSPPPEQAARLWAAKEPGS